MNKFSLKITFTDWLFITIVAVFFSSSLSIIIHTTLNLSWKSGFISGGILGFCLSLLSIVFISLNNKFILPKIRNHTVWWIFSALFAYFAGYFGFYTAYYATKIIGIPIPEQIESNISVLAFFSGLLNYLVGLLIYLFVNMKAKKQELEHLLMEGRIISLNTQLNSHFLFNVLNSIIELIKTDTNRAEEGLIKLSRFLRKALNESHLVELSEEIENVKTYIELENLRYGGLIRLKLGDFKNSSNIKIPRFSIQLLVENAIKHGFSGKELNIEIFFENLASHLRIHVCNDGREIRELSYGIGLSNLSKRLKLLCNGDLEFINPKKNEFVITIPKK